MSSMLYLFVIQKKMCLIVSYISHFFGWNVTFFTVIKMEIIRYRRNLMRYFETFDLAATV